MWKSKLFPYNIQVKIKNNLMIYEMVLLVEADTFHDLIDTMLTNQKLISEGSKIM